MVPASKVQVEIEKIDIKKFRGFLGKNRSILMHFRGNHILAAEEFGEKQRYRIEYIKGNKNHTFSSAILSGPPNKCEYISRVSWKSESLQKHNLQKRFPFVTGLASFWELKYVRKKGAKMQGFCGLLDHIVSD